MGPMIPFRSVVQITVALRKLAFIPPYRIEYRRSDRGGILFPQ
jgi:hypothetical protein